MVTVAFLSSKINYQMAPYHEWSAGNRAKANKGVYRAHKMTNAVAEDIRKEDYRELNKKKEGLSTQ